MGIGGGVVFAMRVGCAGVLRGYAGGGGRGNVELNKDVDLDTTWRTVSPWAVLSNHQPQDSILLVVDCFR